MSTTAIRPSGVGLVYRRILVEWRMGFALPLIFVVAVVGLIYGMFSVITSIDGPNASLSSNFVWFLWWWFFAQGFIAAHRHLVYTAIFSVTRRDCFIAVVAAAATNIAIVVSAVVLFGCIEVATNGWGHGWRIVNLAQLTLATALPIWITLLLVAFAAFALMFAIVLIQKRFSGLATAAAVTVVAAAVFAWIGFTGASAFEGSFDTITGPAAILPLLAAIVVSLLAAWGTMRKMTL